MNDLKPIVEGCTALITAGIGVGCEALVGKFLDTHPKYPNERDLWEILDVPNFVGTKPANSICIEKNLMRIDGHEPTEEESARDVYNNILHLPAPVEKVNIEIKVK